MPLSLTNPWVIIGLIAAGGLIFWLGYERGDHDNEAAHVAQDLREIKLVLDGFKGEVGRITGIAGRFAIISQDLSTEIDAISGKFRNAARANPLPANCAPDAFRVQSLSAAIAATNSAIGRGAVPAVPPAQ